MKPSSLVLASLALSCHAASAAVIPVSEDTYAAPSGMIGKAAGKANFLLVSDGGSALLRFDVADYAGLILPANVSSARVVFHFSDVKKATDLKLQAVTSEWAEAAQGKRPAPSLDPTPLLTIPANAVTEDQFAIVDVTALVKQWLATPTADFGLAISGVAVTNVHIASKEGPLFGHPAWLEIESRPVTGNDQIAAGVDAAKLGDGTVSNAEFSFLDGVLSPLQVQLNTIGTSLTDVTTSAAGKVNRSGDTMTGALTLPADGLKVGANQFHVATAGVGVGTATPGAALDVRGDIKLGPTGQYQATSGEENLRILRCNLTSSNSATAQIRAGKASPSPTSLPVASGLTLLFPSPPNLRLPRPTRTRKGAQVTSASPNFRRPESPWSCIFLGMSHRSSWWARVDRLPLLPEHTSARTGLSPSQRADLYSPARS